MIRPATYYEIICDRCGQRLEADGGITAWQTRDEAEDALYYYGWSKERGQVICHECKLNDYDDEE